jgi:hypothetical protein
MAQLSLGVGGVLIALGVGAYLLTDRVSPTALMPAAFGLVIAMLGAYARASAERRTAVHLAMGVALAGLIGSVAGVVRLVEALAAGRERLPPADLTRGAMAALLLLYLAVGISSLVRARR